MEPSEVKRIITNWKNIEKVSDEDITKFKRWLGILIEIRGKILGPYHPELTSYKENNPINNKWLPWGFKEESTGTIHIISPDFSFSYIGEICNCKKYSDKHPFANITHQLRDYKLNVLDEKEFTETINQYRGSRTDYEYENNQYKIIIILTNEKETNKTYIYPKKNATKDVTKDAESNGCR